MVGDLDAIVVSYGGAGTTEFIQYLGQWMRVNHPNSLQDGIKHANSPAHPVLMGRRIGAAVYLYDDPVRAMISVFRRGLHTRHAAKLASSQHRSGVEYREYVTSHERSMALDQYLAEGRDHLGFGQHVTNWLTHSTTFPILFVRFDVLFESAEAIARFVGLQRNAVASFPVRRPRTADPAQLTVEQSAAADRIYSSLRERLTALPGLYQRGCAASG